MPLPVQEEEHAQRGLLSGSDIYASGVKFVDAFVEDVRESPKGFSSPFIIDFKEYIMGKGSMAVNLTNCKILKVHILKERKVNDLEQLRGAKLRIGIVKTNNPQTGLITWGVRVAKIKLSKKPVHPPSMLGSAEADLGLGDQDCPF